MPSERKSPVQNLLSPLQMGPVPLRNRVVMAPLTRGRAGQELKANDLMAEYYQQRASAGLIISEGSSVSVLGRGWYHAPDVFKPENAEAWRKVTDKVHEEGGLIFCQLWHTGRGSHSSFRDGVNGFEGEMKKGVAPSAIKRKSDTASRGFTPVGGVQGYTPRPGMVPIETPRELSTEEVDAIPEEYRNAAQTAKDGGFDGVEVHCANGYLLDGFLQSCSNKRTDKYGGSFENRFKLINNVLRAVLKVFAPHQVGVRLSPNGTYNGMGSVDFRESFTYYAKRLAEFDLGYLHVMNGLDFGFHNHGKAMTLQDFRQVYPGIIMGNVGYTAETAEKEISEGNADLIAFGRAYLSNPDLVERFAAGAELNEPAPREVYFSSFERDLASEGYTTFPKLV